MESDLKTIQNYCAYQERCHSEVRHKLLELNIRGAELEEIMFALISDDFLNEERFAKSYCGGKFRMKQWGRKKIILNLRRKQVSEYCIRIGLSEIEPTAYWNTLCTLVTKKMEEYKKERSDWIRKQKTIRYLLQKGYEQELIMDALKSTDDI